MLIVLHEVAVLDDSRSYCVGEVAVDFREIIPVVRLKASLGSQMFSDRAKL